MMFRRLSRFNKYGAKRTANGFPSKLEEAVYNMLLLRERTGEISDVKRQQVVTLQEGDKTTRINWKVDFSFLRGEIRCYAEAKGIETSEYILKLKMWRKLRPAPLEIWKGTYLRPVLVERIEV
jgi:hypothetical protein